MKPRIYRDTTELNEASKLHTGPKTWQALHQPVERAPRWQSLNLLNLVADVLRTLEGRIAAQHVQVVTDLVQHQPVLADAEMLRRAVSLLVGAALDMMPRGGELTITAYQQAGMFELEVADSGPGLPEGLSHSAADAISPEQAGALGAGFTAARRIAQAHGGTIAAANCAQGGAAFTIRIPHNWLEAAA